MRNIFIGIGLMILIGVVLSFKWNNPKDRYIIVSEDSITTVQTDSINEMNIDEFSESDRKYYFKGKEITKEEYDYYMSQVEQLKQQLEVLRTIATYYDNSRPNVTYRRYSDGTVETRIDE